jgi:energy-coupling factor transporter ATP-binding protein EcfA2
MQGIVDSNILVLDEIVDASLDQDGISALTDSLKLMQDLNVFIVTHQPEKMIDSVRSVLQFEKVDGFSRIATSK